MSQKSRHQNLPDNVVGKRPPSDPHPPSIGGPAPKARTDDRSCTPHNATPDRRGPPRSARRHSDAHGWSLHTPRGLCHKRARVAVSSSRTHPFPTCRRATKGSSPRCSTNGSFVPSCSSAGGISTSNSSILRPSSMRRPTNSRYCTWGVRRTSAVELVCAPSDPSAAPSQTPRNEMSVDQPRARTPAPNIGHPRADTAPERHLGVVVGPPARPIRRVPGGPGQARKAGDVAV